MYTYPQEPQDDPSQYAELLGNFWPSLYGGANLVLNYLQGVQLNAAQLMNDIFELQASISVLQCPVFHNQKWFSLQLFQSQEVSAHLAEYSQGFVYGLQPNSRPLFYGQPVDGAVGYPFPAGTTVVYGANVLGLQPETSTSNQPAIPPATFVQGVDFELDPVNNRIVFLQSLFSDPRLVPVPVLNTQGSVVDQQITLFFLNAQQDWNYLYQLFGYVIGLNLPSSQLYKDFINVVWLSYNSGTSMANVEAMLAAITDCPIAKADGEVVEYITNDANYFLVITDQQVYRFLPGSSPIVEVGDTLVAGQQLTDTVQLLQPNNGAAPDLDSVTLDSSFLDPTILGPLTFNNTPTSLVVTLDVDGYTKVSWSLGGAGADVTSFFNILHAKGIAAGKTLAMCLDERPQPQATQPTAASLPATINPMAFLFQNVLRGNTLFILLNTELFGYNALGVGLLPFLRQVMPPSTATFVIES